MAMESLAIAAKQFVHRMVVKKRLWFDPREDYGRANIFRGVCLGYFSLFVTYKLYRHRKEAALQIQKERDAENIVKDALARCGLL